MSSSINTVKNKESDQTVENTCKELRCEKETEEKEPLSIREEHPNETLSRYSEDFMQDPNDAEGHTVCNATEYLMCVLSDSGPSGDVSVILDDFQNNAYPEDDSNCYGHEETQEYIGLDTMSECFGDNVVETDQTRTGDVNNPVIFNVQGTKNTCICDTCQHVCNGPSALRRHMVKHSGEKPFSCTLCAFSTGWHSVLRRHLKITHGREKSHACSVCSFSTSWPAALKRHLLTHADSKPYSCDTCDYKCTTIYDLKKHAAKHTKEKPYCCRLCEFSTGWANVLRRHVASVHGDSKWHTCEICGFSTRWVESLRSHKLKHTDSKKHACPECPYRSRLASDLKKHAVTHTKQKPFKCSVCNFSTGWANSLRAHEASHVRDEVATPFRCERCARRFASELALDEHALKKHP